MRFKLGFTRETKFINSKIPKVIANGRLIDLFCWTTFQSYNIRCSKVCCQISLMMMRNLTLDFLQLQKYFETTLNLKSHLLGHTRGRIMSFGSNIGKQYVFWKYKSFWNPTRPMNGWPGQKHLGNTWSGPSNLIKIKVSSTLGIIILV